MSKKNKAEYDMDFDLEGSDSESPEIEIYKQMLEEASSKNLAYEKFLLDRNLMEECNSQFVAPEEIICAQGIEYIKRLVVQGTFTKDDINAFDVLHRNLCMIRGIKLDKAGKKKEVVKSREELLKLVKKG
jgi:hypothetical protein